MVACENELGPQGWIGGSTVEGIRRFELDVNVQVLQEGSCHVQRGAAVDVDVECQIDR